jgi:hypothetical protein
MRDSADRECFVESFNGKFRSGCLNDHWFVDLADAEDSDQSMAGQTD